jgi:uncharacterized protein YjaZ
MADKLKTEPILTNVEVSLAAVGQVALADKDRFLTVFRNVWNRLPTLVRALLSTRWRAVPATVYLTRSWREQPGKVGQCSGEGSVFHFFAPAIAIMPENIVAECIAHELAHAYFYIIRDLYHCGGMDRQLLDEALQERLAEALVRELVTVWGFTPRSFTTWVGDNIEWLVANANGTLA